MSHLGAAGGVAGTTRSRGGEEETHAVGVGTLRNAERFGGWFEKRSTSWDIHLFNYSFIYLYLFIYLSICLSIYRSIDLSIYRSIDLSVYLSLCLSSNYLSITHHL